MGSHCCCERRQEWIQNGSAIARGRRRPKAGKPGGGARLSFFLKLARSVLAYNRLPRVQEFVGPL